MEPPQRLSAWLTQELATRLVREAAAALAPSEVMPLKGTLLARTIYDDPAERPMTDCDLLVVGVSLEHALARLHVRGFQPRQWSNQRDVVIVSSPAMPGLQLDLHTRPLPRGFGNVDAAWLARGARRDVALFGAPVLVPAPARLLVQLLGNIAKDHVFRSKPHHARDVALLLERESIRASEVAATARDAGLAGACWMALCWVAEAEPRSRAREILHALTPQPGVVPQWWALRLAYLRHAARFPSPPLAARLLSRTAADRASDVALALGETALAMTRAQFRAQPASNPR